MKEFYKCNLQLQGGQCTYRSTKKKNMICHLARSHSLHKSGIIQNHYDYGRHMTKVSSRIFDCKECHLVFYTQTKLTKHENLCLSKKEKVEEVKDVAATEIERQTEAQGRPLRKLYSCPTCKKTFATKASMESHQERDHNNESDDEKVNEALFRSGH